MTTVLTFDRVRRFYCFRICPCGCFVSDHIYVQLHEPAVFVAGRERKGFDQTNRDARDGPHGGVALNHYLTVYDVWPQ